METIFHSSVPNTTETAETGLITLKARTLTSKTIAEARSNALKSIYSTTPGLSKIIRVTTNMAQQLLGPIKSLTAEQRRLFQNELASFAKNNISLIQNAHEQDMQRK